MAKKNSCYINFQDPDGSFKQRLKDAIKEREKERPHAHISLSEIIREMLDAGLRQSSL